MAANNVKTDKSKKAEKQQATPPRGSIPIDRVASKVAGAPCWYGFRWNGKGAPPIYLSFPAGNEVIMEAGEPTAILPAPDNGSSLDVVHAAALDGAELDGIAWLAPGSHRTELFRVNGDCLIWTQEIKSKREDKVCLRDSLGFYGPDERAVLVDQGMLPKPAADDLKKIDNNPSVSSCDMWPEPKPLPTGLPSVEQFIPELLPTVFRPWIEDIAERMQCSLDYPAVASMVVLAGAVGKQIGIRPKRHDDWTVIPNLWGGVVGSPGVMKSPALTEILKPLQRLEIAARERYEEELKDYEALEIYREQQKLVISKNIRKAIEGGKDGGKKDGGKDGMQLAREAINNDNAKPIRRRHIVNDPSVEKLGELLNQNPKGLLLFRDELTGFLRTLDKEGHENARAFYLEAWNGDSRYVYDRIGRGTIDIEHTCLSILGGIQPGPLQDYMLNAPEDGLMQRFQLLVWPDISHDWKDIDRWPDAPAKDQAYAVIERLANLNPDALGATPETKAIPYLRIADDAQDLFREWRYTLETRLRRDELPGALESHLAKFRSLIPSLALLIHLAEGGSGPVGLSALERACAWGEYLESHAKRIYAPAIAPDRIGARALAKRILAGDLSDRFVLRDVYNNDWSCLADKESAFKAATFLVDYDWLQQELEPTRGRPKTWYVVNPRIKEVSR